MTDIPNTKPLEDEACLMVLIEAIDLGDIKKSDARQLGTTVNRDLVAPFVAFNWGPDIKPPRTTFQVEDPEDIKALSVTLSKVVPLGFRVAQSDVSKRMGFRVPDADEAVLQISPAAPLAPVPSGTGGIPYWRHVISEIAYAFKWGKDQLLDEYWDELLAWNNEVSRIMKEIGSKL